MQNYKQMEEIDLITGINNYFSFIHSLTLFVIHFFQTRSASAAKDDLLRAEKEVTQSIILIEKLHMFIYLNFTTLNNHLSHHENTNPFENHPYQKLFKKLQKLMSEYDYQTDENRNLCEKTITQILIYYGGENDIQFTLSPVPPPWFSNELSKRKEEH